MLACFPAFCPLCPPFSFANVHTYAMLNVLNRVDVEAMNMKPVAAKYVCTPVLSQNQYILW